MAVATPVATQDLQSSRSPSTIATQDLQSSGSPSTLVTQKMMTTTSDTLPVTTADSLPNLLCLADGAIEESVDPASAFQSQEGIEPLSPTEAPQNEDDELKDDDQSGFIYLERLGVGAQAQVFKAIWWKKFGQTTSAITVAVKKVHPSSSERVTRSELLTLEIQHPHLLQCFQVTHNPLLIVTEYRAGGSLYDCIYERNIQVTWQQRLKIQLDVAKGVGYLHSLDPIIIHRDLKSSNVLLAKAITSASVLPNAKVADFGLSRVVENGMEASEMMTRCVGTWRWMAPEVFSSTTYTESIDVYSFAILMYELLTRAIPYADEWPLNSVVNPRIGLHILNGRRPHIELVQPGCPCKVRELMQACWSKSPTERPTFATIIQLLQGQLDLVTVYSQVKQELGPF